jgi:hypothetical protein
MKTVVILNTNQMGHGNPVLGQRILSAFLNKSPVMDRLTAIVMFNHGVKLITRDSPVLQALHHLHEAGVELLPCGTCLDFYGLEPELVKASDMDEIVRTIDAADKVVTL